MHPDSPAGRLDNVSIVDDLPFRFDSYASGSVIFAARCSYYMGEDSRNDDDEGKYDGVNQVRA